MDFFHRPLQGQLCLGARQDHRKVEGFGDVVVRPKAQSGDNIFALIFGGSHDDRQVGHGIALAQDLQDIKAADAGHHNIEKDQVELLRFKHLQGLLAVCRHGDGVTAPCQTPRQHIAVHLIVVDDEQGALSQFHTVVSLLQECLDLAQQSGEFDRLGVVVVAACLERFFPIA